jgi:hypothetical protein
VATGKREGGVSVSVMGGSGRASACIVIGRGGSDSGIVDLWGRFNHQL